MSTYVKLGLAVGLVVLTGLALWFTYDAGHDAGTSKEKAAWQKREIVQQQTYAAELKRLRDLKDGQLAALQAENDKAIENYEKKRREHANERAKNERFAADLRAGRLVLRDPGRPAAGEACGGQGPAGAPAIADGDGPAAQPRGLSSELASFLWAEAARADEVIEDLESRLTLAQDTIGAYYRMARDCSVVGN